MLLLLFLVLLLLLVLFCWLVHIWRREHAIP